MLALRYLLFLSVWGEDLGSQVGVGVHEGPDQGIAVGVKAVTGHGEDGIAWFNGLAVEDRVFVHNAHDA